MQKYWDKKVVLITGAGSGIGKALAHHLAKLGAQLIISDLNAETLEQTRAELSSSILVSLSMDISNKADWQALYKEIDEKVGYLDVLVNNAGMSPFGYFDETSEGLFDKVMAVNFNGAVMGCRVMQPLLERSQQGLIANVASIFGIITVPMLTSYHASKFALRGFTEALAQDYRYQAKNIDVVCIMPGGIQTNIANNAESDAEEKIDFSGHFNEVALTTPEKAAKVIEKGMRRKQSRIFIGADAYLVTLLQKWFPTHYSKIFNPLMGINKLLNR